MMDNSSLAKRRTKSRTHHPKVILSELNGIYYSYQIRQVTAVFPKLLFLLSANCLKDGREEVFMKLSKRSSRLSFMGSVDISKQAASYQWYMLPWITRRAVF